MESPFSYRDWKRFFFISGEGWETLPNKNLDEAPRFLHQWGPRCLVHLFLLPSFASFVLCLVILFFFSVKACPHLKSRYKDLPKRVLGYVDEVKDFDDLINPNNLSLHFLGQEPSGGVL